MATHEQYFKHPEVNSAHVISPQGLLFGFTDSVQHTLQSYVMLNLWLPAMVHIGFVTVVVIMIVLATFAVVVLQSAFSHKRYNTFL